MGPLKINKDFAEKFNKRKEREELQKLKEKYGDDPVESETSSSESEDEDAEALTDQLEKDWLVTLAAIKSKNPKIYDSNIKFFNEETAGKEKSNSLSKKIQKKDQPMFLKDYERKVILEKDGILSDDEQSDDDCFGAENKIGIFSKEQQELKNSFKKFLDDDDDDDDEQDTAEGIDTFMTKRKVTKEEKTKQDLDYIHWLSGQKDNVEDESISTNLQPLKKLWSDPSIEEKEKFLRDFILEKQYLDNNSEDEERVPTYEEILENTDIDDEDDEDQMEREEIFEQKFNSRFEQPDEEFIKNYPRTVADSIRVKDTKRASKRKQLNERKKMEKMKKKEELKQLKNLKKKEILEKLGKIEEVLGDKVKKQNVDFEEDFDPEKHDNFMKELLGNDYYEQEADTKKPVFNDDIDNLLNDEYGIQDWNNWTGNNNEGHENFQKEDVCQGNKTNQKAIFLESNKRKRKSKFAEALERKKPLFDPSQKTFEEYLNEYYNLDYEDIIAGQPCRFSYRKVLGNDFGLSVDEILKARDKELNAWVSVKKMSQYRTEEEEISDLKIFKHKARKKDNILTSLYSKDPEELADFKNNKIINRTNSKLNVMDPKSVKNKSKNKNKLKDDIEELAGSKNDKKNDPINKKLNSINLQIVKNKSKKKNKSKDDLEKLTDSINDKIIDPIISNSNSTKLHIVKNKSKKKNNLKKNKNSDKKSKLDDSGVNMSEDRMNAYKIQPKKFKYFYLPKIQNKNVNNIILNDA